MTVLQRLEALAGSGALEAIDLHFARAVARWGGEDEAVVLGAALVSHLAGAGHVCADLASMADGPLPFDRDWIAPSLAAWQEAVRNHPACVGDGSAPLVLDGCRLYLARHWRDEGHVAAELARRASDPLVVDEALLARQLDALFDAADPAVAGQRQAAALAARQRVVLISGGPGTGKTTTLAALLALAIGQCTQGGTASESVAGASTGSARTVAPLARTGAPLRVLLAAPTGKAAARMQESVGAAKRRLSLAPEVAALIPDQARTLHRLLGLRPGGGARHHAGHPLAVDLLVVDEASMVDLALMAKLLAALPPQARLVLLGDRDQLASVEAGAVFADLCFAAGSGGILASGYGQLSHSFRFGGMAGIGRLARCLRNGDGDGTVALLTEGSDGLQWQQTPVAEALVQGTLEGYAPYLDAVVSGAPPSELHRCFASFRLLAAHRQGPWGVGRFNAAIERALGQRFGHGQRQPWYAGRPVMVNANDYTLGLFNGDIGIAAPDGHGELMVWFEGDDGLRAIPPHRLPAFDPAWALTVHKSQGSEFDAVLLALPDQPSPLVTRELVYTAVTRAKQQVSLWATPGALRDACGKGIARYSGLAGRLK
ncbi:exodeoxyribonuclease V subunit alpha [Denitratisoma oestradiolicum]|uniref:RecBCD enzyme subunit RecD n=1 Tax=Denitratisoma oestradiolicum TaxID=311182 RepID=A0A6S6XVD3_9PROT|nr:exodeoxyribonuclease V subunit alpha [Denitratisoma oestradiolicum]TWO81941.1 exodeoxyribonuclease V subunit alpha [Denitratisoma oestradiolicum]CAB1368840.1 exonuclease V (RecBCD complex), alpha chain [Denitratisoma oestradiolicum]